MNGFNKYLAATFLSAAMLFTGSLQAMEIWQFDKMADQDQADFITILVRGAEKVLNDEGRGDLAAKMDQLFTEIHPGDRMPLGMIEFEENLDHARVFDAERHAKDHSVQRVEVEDAMAVTLHKNGIELPDTFFTVASNFKPKLPLNDAKAKKDTKTKDDKKKDELARLAPYRQPFDCLI